MSRKRPTRESLERTVDGLRQQRDKDRRNHAAVVAAKNDELRALRESWELIDTYPALPDFLLWLHKIRDAYSPLRSPSYQPGHTADQTTQPERGITPDTDRTRLSQVNSDLEYWTTKLRDRLTPKGPLVDSEHRENPPPRCHNPECPARLISQAYDREICHECKTPFTEFRPDAKGKRSRKLS